MMSIASIESIIRDTIRKELERLKDSFSKHDVHGVLSEYDKFVSSVRTVKDRINELFLELDKEAYRIFTKTFYSKVSIKPLNEIVDLALKAGVLDSIEQYVSREKILSEASRLDYNKLYKLFRSIRDKSLKDSLFNIFLSRVREIPCRDVFDYLVELIGYSWFSTTSDMYRSYGLKILEEYVDSIPVKCNNRDIRYLLDHTRTLDLIRSANQELYKKLIDNVIEYYITSGFNGFDDRIVYTLKRERLLDDEQLYRLLNGLLDEVLSNHRKVVLLEHMGYLIYGTWFPYTSGDKLNLLCKKASKLWDDIVLELERPSNFIDFIEVYVGLVNSKLNYWLSRYCKREVTIPDLDISVLRDLLRNSVRENIPYSDLRKAIELLRSVDKYAAKRLLASLKYYKRKYGL